MIHLPSNIIEALSDNADYEEKFIKMQDHVYDIQDLCKPTDLISNFCLYGLLQGSTQVTPIYLEIIPNLILHCKLRGQ